MRIRDTYMYFGATVGMTAMSAVAVSRNPRLMGMMMKNSWMVCDYWSGITRKPVVGVSDQVRH